RLLPVCILGCILVFHFGPPAPRGARSVTASKRRRDTPQRMGLLRSRILPLFLLSAASGALAQVGQEWEPSQYFGRIVRGIDYAADRPLDRTHYDPFLGLRPGDPLTRTAVKHAIQALYDPV